MDQIATRNFQDLDKGWSYVLEQERKERYFGFTAAHCSLLCCLCSVRASLWEWWRGGDKAGVAVAAGFLVVVLFPFLWGTNALVLNGRLLLIKLWLRRPANCAVDFLVVA
jgi:hypothetical protein